MIRYWINLKTLQHRINDLEYGYARTDAETWLGASDLGWFDSVEKMHAYVMAELLPVLEQAWASNPHCRLGQLISNALGAGPQDPYYVTDGELRDKLEALIDN